MIGNRQGLAALLAGALAASALSATANAQTTPPTPAPPVAAVNPCTGADEAKCGTIAACAWLPGYKVKGAPDVPGYCRTAPKPLTARRPGDLAAPAVKQ
jgi:hypothetical protein